MPEDQRHSPSDSALIEAARGGDVRAFETLYFRYRDWVATIARRFCANDADALDVTQEVFVYLLGRISSLTLTARLTTFLYPAIRNLSISARKRARRSAPGGESELAGAVAPEAATESLADLHGALSGISEAHREIVLMRFVDDMTLAEIAEALELPLGTAKSRLHHAVAALRQDPRMQRYFDAGG